MHPIRYIRSLIARIPDPRIVSMILAVAYMTFTLTGLATLISPPQSIVGAVGDVTMVLVGAFLLCGGAVGMIAGALEFWELERAAITSMGAGLIIYAGIVGYLQATESGSRFTQLGVIIGTLCFLALRLATIWRYDFKPRG